MRILHVREVANVGSTLVQGLRVRGHEAELMPARAAGGAYPFLVKGLFLPHRLGEAIRINRYVHQGNFDVVHIHVAYMGWLGILGGYPYLLHTHGHDIRANLSHPLMGWFTRRALERAVRVFYATPDLAPVAKSVREDAVFIPNPVNTDRFRPLERAANERPRVLLISRLEPIKGISLAFRVVEEVKRRLPQVEVDTFAWGPLYRKFRACDRVRFIPTVPYSQMADLINRYDMVLGQFSLGILSMSELEAMACGKPVVSYFKYLEAYDAPPPLISGRHPEELADNMTALLEDSSARKELGESGRSWVEDHHDYLKVARMLEEHYMQRELAFSGQGVNRG